MKKRLFALALAGLLCLSLLPAAAAPGGRAVATTQTVLVDGQPVTFETYALLDRNNNQTNYAKLRDVAYVLDGTQAQFNVGWTRERGVYAETGKSYKQDGSEMHTPYSGDRAYTLGKPTTEVDGVAVGLDAIVLTDDLGGGYTYYKLRDLGAALGFTVDWTKETGVTIDTTVAPAPLPTAEENAQKLLGSWKGDLELSDVTDLVLADHPEIVPYCHFTPAQAAVTVDFTPDSYALVVDRDSLAVAMDTVAGQLADGMMAYLADYAQENGVTLDMILAIQGTDQESFRTQLIQTAKDSVAAAQLDASGLWKLEGNRLLTAETADDPWEDDGTSIAFPAADALRLTVSGIALNLVRQ